MTQKFRLFVREGKDQVVQTIDIQQGAGGQAKPVTVKAKAGARYQLAQVDNPIAPHTLRANRVGKHLHILLQDSQEADLIIEDYYEEMPVGPNALLGQAENGLVYEYIPQNANAADLMAKLSDGGQSVSMVLGGSPESFLVGLPQMGATGGVVPGWIATGFGAMAVAASAVKPTPAVQVSPPGLALATDSGTSSTDRITNTSTLNVTGLDLGATWQYSLDGGTSWSNGTGTTITGISGDGVKSVLVKQTDAAGNASPASSAFIFTLDTTAPAKPNAPADLLASADTGASDSDNITQNSRPSFQVGAPLPEGVSALELLVNGQWVPAVYNAQTGMVQPVSPLSDGAYNISYRHVDEAGNRGPASDALALSLDTTPPAPRITTKTPAGIGGTCEVGATLSLTIAGQAVTGNISFDGNGRWNYVPTAAELALLRQPGAKELLVAASDAAGNTASDSRTVTEDDFYGPYIKEFIPADSGVLANGQDGKATLNLVFSKDVVKGSGAIKLFELGSNTLLATIDVSSVAVRIESGRDVFITLPGLSTGTVYYVTLDAGSFADLAGDPFAGLQQAGTDGWDFTAVIASIAPDFVAGDDVINAGENAAQVLITGKVMASAAIAQAIAAANLTVSVSVPVGKPAVTATVQSYNNATGEYVFSVPASAWADGDYGYTVSLAGGTGAASGITASYSFNALAVDLTAPSMTASISGAQDDVGSITGDLWASADSAITDDTSPSLSGTLYAPLTGDARVVVYRQDVSQTNAPGPLISLTGAEGLKPAGTAWSLNDSGLQDGRSYKYIAYVEDAAGNRSAASAAKTLTIDTTAPQVSIMAASLSVDTGVSANDWITNVASQTITGTLSAALASGEKLQATLNGGLSWQDVMVSGTSFTWTGVTLQPGQGSVSFRAIDAAGNASPASSAFAFTLDTSMPLAPGLNLTTDSGTSSSDTLTNTSSLNVTGLEVGSTWQYSLNGGTSWSNGSGTSITGITGDGLKSVLVKQTDAAGNTSAASSALAFTLDTAASAPSLSLATDSGSSSTDRITKISSLNVTGLEVGATWQYSLNGGTSWINGSGTTITGITGDGLKSVLVKQTDAAGNASPASSAFTFTLDTAAAAPTLSLATDSGSSSSDFITNIRTVNVNGLEAGATWQFSLDGGTGWSSGTGTSFTTAPNATYAASAIQVRQTDAAGNTSAIAGNTQTWVVDTTPPAPEPSFAVGNNVRSSEVGNAYLVLSSRAVSSLSDILALPSSEWNSVAITSAGTNTLLPRGGLGTGNYVLYSMDTAGNLSAPSAARSVTNPVMSVSLLLAAGFGFRIAGKDLQDGAGVSVHGLGDVNGDGLDDVIVGAPFASAGNGDGQAYVVFGIPNSNRVDVNLSAVASGTGGFAINLPAAGGRLGTSVTGIGDINGDGRADLMVGAPGLAAGAGNAGRTYVVFGKSSGSAVDLSTVSSGTGGFVITDDAGASRAGTSIASAGDFNGDGLTDFIVAAPGPVSNGTTPTPGDVFLVYGSANFQDISLSAIAASTGGFKIAGSGSQQLGFSVSSAGDLNRDGFSDIVIGAPNDNAGAGKVLVKYGGPSANNGGFEITAPALSRLGTSVSGGGDVNGDGYADLIIGGPQRDTQTDVLNGPGKAYVVFGGATNNDIDVSAMGTRGFVINGANAQGDAGMSVSFVGDINGDGLSEMIVGEDLAPVNGRAQAGNTYVVFGKTSTTAVELSDVAKGIGGFIVAGSNAHDRNGWSVSAAGDIDGDGLADLIIGAKGESLDRSTVGAGKAFVVFGSASGNYYESSVDQTAAAGGSTLTSTGGQTLLGGVGNDTLISAGADVLYGGRGNDSFVLKDAMVTALLQGFNATTQTLARASGGAGIDTLQLADGVTLDLTAIANTGYGLDVNGSGGSRIQSIEVIDMETDTAANTLNLRLSDVLDMSGMNVFNSSNTSLVSGAALDATVAKHQVAIYGDAADSLNLGAATGWSPTGNVVTYNGHNLVVYNNTNTAVQLLIDQAMVDAGRVLM